MKLLQKTKWVIALVVVATSLFFTGVALASYSGSGYFATNQMYRCHSGSYATENQNASAQWSAVTDLDIYYSCSGSNIGTLATNFGILYPKGHAYICANGSGHPCDTIPEILDHTYTYCQAQSNTYYLDSWTSTQRQFNATHELGHCWSLAHDTNGTSVMQQGQLSIVNPNATNISEVNARH